MRILKKLLAWWVAFSLTSALVGMLVKLIVKSEDDPTAPSFKLVTIFDGTEFRPSSRQLAASQALTMFGGTQLDLRRAVPAGNDVRLAVITVMGGMDITVPDTWRVKVEGTAVMGGHDVHVAEHASLPSDAPTLTIVARTVFAGLRVRSRPVLQAAGTG